MNENFEETTILKKNNNKDIENMYFNLRNVYLERTNHLEIILTARKDWNQFYI